MDNKEVEVKIDWSRFVPYQCCPVCNGSGIVLADGFISSVYQMCKVCNGNMIIPMHILPIENGLLKNE